MYKILSSGGRASYDVNTYICDTEAELLTIPYKAMGDRCFVIEEYATYVVNGAGQWLKLPNNTTEPITSMSSVFGRGVIGQIIFGRG